MLGKTYMAMKDKEKALLWLTKAKEYPAHTLEDKEVHTPGGPAFDLLLLELHDPDNIHQL